MPFGPTFDLNTLNGANGFRIHRADSFWGLALDGGVVGDINGDGVADLFFEGFRLPPLHNVSEAHVIFGRAGAWPSTIDVGVLDSAVGFRIRNSAGDAQQPRHWDVSGAGDVNGDGYDDLLVGDSSDSYIVADQFSPGTTYLIFGRATGWSSGVDLAALDGITGFRIDGIDPADHFGSGVSGATDINGDGYDDIFINAWGAGESYVIFGRPSGWNASLSLPSSLDGVSGFRTPAGLRSCGDINADGYDDLIIGDAGADSAGQDSGSTYVVFGKPGGWAANLDVSTLNGTNGFRIDGAFLSDRSHGINGAGDVNGDGFADIMIAAVGETWIVFGKAGGWGASLNLSSLNGANGFKIATPVDYVSQSPAGDINGDGYDDILMMELAHPLNNDVSSVYVIFGRASGWAPAMALSSVNGANGFRIPEPSTHFNFALNPFNLFTGGDVNDDGFDDILIQDDGNNFNAEGYRGEHFVIFGQAQGPIVRQGTAGDDLMRSGEFNDSLSGLGGDDVLMGRAGNDILNGGSGSDTASYAGGAAVIVSLALVGSQNTGGQGADTLTGIENLTGSSFNDTLTGDANANVLAGGAGADVLDGGAGVDTASYASSASRVVVQLTVGPIYGGDAEGDTLTQIENVIGSAFGDNLQGDANANALSGGDGNDTLNGRGGSDTLRGEAGDDYLYIDEQDLSGGLVRGGAGYDWVFNQTSGLPAALLAVNLATLEAEGYHGGNGAEQVNAAGMTTSVTLYGNGGADQLTGGSGNDYIYFDAADLSGGSIAGGAGYDWAMLNEHVGVSLNLAATGFEGGYGRNGNDTFNASGVASSVTLYGNGGSDTLIGGSGNDYVYFDAADLSGGAITGGAGYDWAILNEHVGISLNLAATGFEGGYGRDGNDVFNASGVGGSVTLYGNGGSDTLTGGSGSDYIYFDAADLASGAIAGGAGYDYAIFNVLGVGTSLNLTATGFEGAVGRNGDDVFTAAGSAGSVSLYGYEGNDQLTGGSGSDYLYGDTGNDTLTGGAGADVLVTYAGWGNDTLVGFEQGIDRIEMSVSGLSAFSQLAISQDGADALVSYNGNSLRFLNTSAAAIDVSDFINLANAMSAEDPQMLVAGKTGEAGPATLPDLAGDTDADTGAGLTMESVFGREDPAEALLAGGDFPQAWREAWPKTFWSDAADLHAFKTEWPPWTIGG